MTISDNIPRLFHISRFGLAGILVLAAGTKFAEATTVAPMQSGPKLLLASVEAALGLWLLSGTCMAIAWKAVGGVFAVFIGTAASRLIAGHYRCECFGAVDAHPFAVAALDLAALTAILAFPPPSEAVSSRKRLLGVMTAMALIGFSADAAGYTDAFRRSSDRTTVFETISWTGRRLPVIDDIEIGVRLEKGTWLLVFHRSGCPRCEQLLAALSRPRAPRASGSGPARPLRLGIIDVFPTKPPMRPSRGEPPGSVRGQMKHAHSTFANLPTVVLMRQGRVVAVGGASLATKLY